MFAHYVDDGIFLAEDRQLISEAIRALRDMDYDLTEESDLSGYLGIDISYPSDSPGTIEMRQEGLIKKIMSALNLRVDDGGPTHRRPVSSWITFGRRSL